MLLVPDSRDLIYLSLPWGSYVGNTMAAFVMQVLGYEVAALNTVQFSKLRLPLSSKDIYI